MANVGRVDADPEHLQRRMTKRCGCNERGGEAHSRPACPSDHRPARELLPAGRRPDTKMIFGDRDCCGLQRFQRAAAVEPGRRNKTVDRPSGDVLNQGPPGRNPLGSFIVRQAQELAFARSHEARSKAIGLSIVPGKVAMIIAMQEDLDAGLCPATKARRERRTGNDRRIAPMVGNDQHCHSIADMFTKYIDKLVYFGFEARRNVMDRR